MEGDSQLRVKFLPNWKGIFATEGTEKEKIIFVLYRKKAFLCALGDLCG